MSLHIFEIVKEHCAGVHLWRCSTQSSVFLSQRYTRHCSFCLWGTSQHSENFYLWDVPHSALYLWTEHCVEYIFQGSNRALFGVYLKDVQKSTVWSTSFKDTPNRALCGVHLKDRNRAIFLSLRVLSKCSRASVGVCSTQCSFSIFKDSKTEHCVISLRCTPEQSSFYICVRCTPQLLFSIKDKKEHCVLYISKIEKEHCVCTSQR